MVRRVAVAACALFLMGAGGPDGFPTRRAGEVAAPEFRIAKLVFCRVPPAGLDDFVPERPGRRYRPGEAVHCYLGVEDVPNARAGKGYAVRLTRTWTVYDASGKPVRGGGSYSISWAGLPRPMTRFYNHYLVGLTGLAPGRYVVACVLTDEGSGRTVRKSAAFTVTAPE